MGGDEEMEFTKGRNCGKLEDKSEKTFGSTTKCQFAVIIGVI